MLVGCKNCGGYFNADELQRLKPPRHPWGLTTAGQRALAHNTAQHATGICPKCGQNTLAPASVARYS